MLEGPTGGGTRIGRVLDETGTKVRDALMLKGSLCMRISIDYEWRYISSG